MTTRCSTCTASHLLFWSRMVRHTSGPLFSFTLPLMMECEQWKLFRPLFCPQLTGACASDEPGHQILECKRTQGWNATTCWSMLSFWSYMYFWSRHLPPLHSESLNPRRSIVSPVHAWLFNKYIPWPWRTHVQLSHGVTILKYYI